MKMNALALGWLVFLALIKNFSCPPTMLFTLEDGPLTATEGSCIEIKCSVTLSNDVDVEGAYWFWIKNPTWHKMVLTGTVIYSSNETDRPVSSDFADRVKYTGSPSSTWNNHPGSPPELCNILICNLNKTDSGNYTFRFVGKHHLHKWITNPAANLNVTENPCPITFEKPAAVNESGVITLTCSTSSSCTSELQIGGLELSSTPQQRNNGKQKSITVNLTPNWNDDGKEFSCKTKDNDDKYLIQNISVTVEYAPKNTLAKISSQNVKEGQSVTLTCSAKGRPAPTFTWFKNKQEAVEKTGAEWSITSIRESQDGEYHCKATNKHGTTPSKPVNIKVQYRPEVEVKSSSSLVKEGEKMTLTCNVKRSNPPPSTYSWFKDRKAIHQKQTQYVVERIQPENSGSYTCSATNTVGTGTSGSRLITVEYGPRKTSIHVNDKKVKVGSYLTFYCNTDANPPPLSYSWYRYNMKKPTDSSKWSSKNSKENVLHLDRVERSDKACYMCNATNKIKTGDDSEPVCIEVLYPPTQPMLTMTTELREDQLLTISCSVESFPPSELTLRRTSKSKPQSSQLISPETWPFNTLHHKFNVTSTDTGVYTCGATNSEGLNTSTPKTLVVKYRPKDVTVKAEPALVVNENKSLTLNCDAQSHPPVTSVTWMKMNDGKSENIGKNLTFFLKSVSPSDSGLYSCTASNAIGTGNSQEAEVKVKYAPKHTNITRAAEQQQPDGTRSVKLSCSSHSYPPVTHYSWYKIKAEEGDEKVSERQTYTVYSNEPGSYYCIAKNEINQRKSDPVHLFDQTLMKALYIFLFLIILFIIILIVFIYRRRRKKSIQQGTANTVSCLGFLGWWNDARRRNQMDDPGMAGPFRSRDDLLSDRCQPRPDSTPTSNITSVYCTVNPPSGKQGPSAQKPIRQQGGHTQDDSLNYASLQFGNKQKHNPAKAEDVYSMVSKQKPPKKIDERPEDYENVSAAHTAKSQNALNYDTDTSEDELEINYSQVSFKAKPGFQRAGRDSSSSDEEMTQYSEVKI